MEPFVTSQEGIELMYDITYDEFGEGDFENQLRHHIQSQFPSIKVILPGKSNEVKELQAADVCIGCMRRSLNDEDIENFSHLKQISVFAQVELTYDPRNYAK